MIGRRAGDLRVFATPELVAAALADRFAACAREADAERGTFFVALAGGTTPKTAYALLAQEPRRSAVPWARVQVYFGDERCVGPDDPQSNYGMARAAFLIASGIPQENVHRIHGEADPAQAAQEYAQLLVRALGAAPRFDLIMLGMGTDGHTASLFPGSDPLIDSDRLVRAVFAPALGTHRITITPAVINSAANVVIATEGAAKAAALDAVLNGPYDPALHPIQIVSPADGTLTWLVDKAAARQ